MMHASPWLPRRWAHAVLLLTAALLLAWLLPLFLGAGGSLAADGPGLKRSSLRLVKLSTNSLKMAGGAALGAVLLAVLPAVVAARAETPGRRRWLVLLALVPLFVPPGVGAVVGVHLLGAEGLMTRLFIAEGTVFPVTEVISGTPSVFRAAPIFSIWGAAGTLAVCYAPVAFLAMVAFLSRVDRAAEEAALLEASSLRVALRVSLPLALPGMVLGAAAVFALALVEFSVPESLRALPVLVGEVFVQFGVFYDTAAATRAALLCVLLALAGVAVVKAALPRDRNEDGEGGTDMAPALRRARGFRALGWGLALLPVALLLGVLWWQLAQGERGAGISVSRWEVLARTAGLAKEELLFGTVLAAGSACGSVLLAVLWGSALAGFRRAMLWRGMLFGVFLLPGPVWAIGLKAAMRAEAIGAIGPLSDALYWLEQTTIPVMVVWALRFGALGALLVERAMRRVPEEWLAVARLEGASRPALWSHLLPPVLGPVLLAVFLFSMALALTDPGAAILLLPPGNTTISVRLLTLMHYAPQSEVSALCILSLLPGMVLLGVLFVLRNLLGRVWR